MKENIYKASDSNIETDTKKQILCPNCGSEKNKKIKFTWWGGFLGPSLLNHIKCLECGCNFNSKTGKSNNVFIIVYSLITLIILFGITWFTT